MAQSQYIKLRSTGAIFNANHLVAIVRQELNVYGFVIKECPVVLKGDGSDVDAVCIQLGIDIGEEPKEITIQP
jgi:hypothetical protein